MRGRVLELNAKGPGEHSVMVPRNTVQIAEALALAQDTEHHHQQQVPGRDAHTLQHPGASGIDLRKLIRKRLVAAETLLGTERGEIPPT